MRPYGGVEARDRIAERRRRYWRRVWTCSVGTRLAELTVRGICRQAGVSAAVLLRELHRQGRLCRGGLRLGDRRYRRDDAGGGGGRAPGRTEPGRHGEHRQDHRRRRTGGPPAVQLAARQRGRGPQAGGIRRADGVGRFSQQAGTLGVQKNDRIKATSHFVVGGVVQAVSAWLTGEVDLEPGRNWSISWPRSSTSLSRCRNSYKS